MAISRAWASRPAVQKPHLLAVREKDEGDVKQRCVMDALVLCGEWLDRSRVCLDNAYGSPGAVAEHVVGARAVRQARVRTGRSCRQSDSIRRPRAEHRS